MNEYRQQDASAASARSPIALLSDFGYRDHYVGVMKGVIASIAPAAPMIDITHGVPPQSVIAGALALREAVPYFPPGTIFLAVVDPGVGTGRRPVAVLSRSGLRFVGPDNGLLDPAVERAGGIAVAVELKEPKYRLHPTSTTFHGRDVFAPAAAHLWRETPLEALGPRVAELKPCDLGRVATGERQLSGTVVYVDGFGNLITNLGRAEIERWARGFRDHRLSVRIENSEEIELHATYAEVAEGHPLALFGSFEMLEIAIRNGSAAAHFGVGPGATVTVSAR